MYVYTHTHTQEGRKCFYLTTHSTHFLYGYMASVRWYRTTQIGREETRCRHMGYSFHLAARVLLYASSHRQDDTYHGLCYTSCGALAGMRNSSMGPPWRIDPTIHRTMSERSYHGATSRSPTHRYIYMYVCMYIYLYIQMYIQMYISVFWPKSKNQSHCNLEISVNYTVTL